MAADRPVVWKASVASMSSTTTRRVAASSQATDTPAIPPPITSTSQAVEGTLCDLVERRRRAAGVDELALVGQAFAGHLGR